MKILLISWSIHIRPLYKLTFPFIYGKTRKFAPGMRASRQWRLKISADEPGNKDAAEG